MTVDMSRLVPVPKPALVAAVEAGPPDWAVACPHQPSWGMLLASTMLPATALTGAPALSAAALPLAFAAKSSTRSCSVVGAERVIVSVPPPVKIVSPWVRLPVIVSLPIEPPSTLPALVDPTIVAPVLAPTDRA